MLVRVVKGGATEVFLQSPPPNNAPALENNDPIKPGAQDQLLFVERGACHGGPNITPGDQEAVLFFKPELEGGRFDENATIMSAFVDQSADITSPGDDVGGDPLDDGEGWFSAMRWSAQGSHRAPAFSGPQPMRGTRWA